jgi:hypothetical protein
MELRYVQMGQASSTGGETENRSARNRGTEAENKGLEE